MNIEKAQAMKLNDNELEMVNGGSYDNTSPFDGVVQPCTPSNCPYEKGGKVDKYNICAGKQYVAWDNSSWNIVVALSDNFEEPGWCVGTDTYAKFRILSSTNPSLVGQTKKWGLGKWHHGADIYEYLG